MKFRQWVILGFLLALVILAVAAFIATRDSGGESTGTAPSAAAHSRRVDTSPLRTARGLAALAVTREERRLARDAEHIADHEVDLAFADALREAREQTTEQDPKYRELNGRIHDAQTAVDEDKAQIARLKAALASAKPAAQESLQDQIALLEAQQAPDEGELDAAQQDLIRAGGDREGAIQRQRAAHEANEDLLAKSPPAPSQSPTVDLAAANLAGQVRAWIWLKNKLASLEAARREIQDLGKDLQTQHDALERRVRAEEPQKQQTRQQARGLREKAAHGAASKEAAAAAVASFQHFSNDRKLLSGLSKQLQDQQDLSEVYGSWAELTAGQQRAALHGMLRSLLWILLIVFLVYVASRLVDRVYTEAAPERKRLLTLRSVLRFGLQAVGVLLIAFVIFGAPNQTPTVLGLAGAGLTVALKDFIVAFFGWFVLMGRNGIRVGDWVEINGVVGEVTEIGLLRTVLLETGNWTDTGHPTGRKVAFVNSFAIEGHFFNFSTAGQWLWDELQVMIPPGENPYPLVETIQRLVEEETRASASQAEQEWKKSAGQRMQSLSVAPAIHLRPTAAGVEMQVRYITSANERYVTRSRMYEKIVGLLHGQAKTQGPAMPVQHT
ncbi:MAG: mechanosensitive ion channel domain-containing protein [Terriglobales bacterium]